MKRSAIIILILGIVFVLSAPLVAYGQDSPNYVVLKAGVYSPTGDIDDMGFDTGFTGEIAVGHYYTPNVALEVGAGYSESDSDFGGEEWDASAISLTLTVKGVIPIKKVELFAGAGIGLYFVNLEITVPGGGSVDDDDTVFGGHLVLGGNVDVSSNVFLGIEGKYIFTDDVGVLSGSLAGDLNGFMVTGNIGYRF